MFRFVSVYVFAVFRCAGDETLKHVHTIPSNTNTPKHIKQGYFGYRPIHRQFSVWVVYMHVMANLASDAYITARNDPR